MKRELSINELNNVEGGFGIAAVIGLTFASAIIAFRSCCNTYDRS